MEGKLMATLIAYFSRTDENYVGGSIRELKVGNTARVAEMIQKLTGADMFWMEMAKPYARTYNECINEAQKDQKADARPELTSYPESIDGYETIYLGYPNYWGTMPMAVFTFLEHFDFSGKTIRPFCTHEGSGLGSSVQNIRKTCPDANVESGLAVHGSRIDASKGDVEDWIKSVQSK